MSSSYPDCDVSEHNNANNPDKNVAPAPTNTMGRVINEPDQPTIATDNVLNELEQPIVLEIVANTEQSPIEEEEI